MLNTLLVHLLLHGSISYEKQYKCIATEFGQGFDIPKRKWRYVIKKQSVRNDWLFSFVAFGQLTKQANCDFDSFLELRAIAIHNKVLEHAEWR